MMPRFKLAMFQKKFVSHPGGCRRAAVSKTSRSNMACNRRVEHSRAV